MVHQLSLLSLFSLMPFISKKEEAIQRKNTDPPNIAIAPENCSATYLDIPTENHVELLVLIWLISTGYGVVVDQKPLLSGFSLLRFFPPPPESLPPLGWFILPTQKTNQEGMHIFSFSAWLLSPHPLPINLILLFIPYITCVLHSASIVYYNIRDGCQLSHMWWLIYNLNILF